MYISIVKSIKGGSRLDLGKILLGSSKNPKEKYEEERYIPKLNYQNLKYQEVKIPKYKISIQ